MKDARKKDYIRLSVLPLHVQAEEARVHMFCDGLAMDLTGDLSRFRPFQVISSGVSGRPLSDESVMDTEFHRPELDYVVRGMAIHRDDMLQLTIQLMQVAEKRVVWTEKFRGRLGELFLLQEDIAEKIVVSLQQVVDEDVLHALRHKPLTSLGAYELWLRGYQELKQGTLQSHESARTFFRQAMEIDSRYARAYTGMSLTYFNEWSCRLWSRWDVARNGAYEWVKKSGRTRLSRQYSGR